ncbi:telomere repeats-binding bouquet formation protein 2 isoform X2 [Engystomops pustulosus]|uniref:telomere repeats-binding bouquet formation protein 2 isoform X2 n=1 Tax=Engystomops pustulosus TaxID=76066 RepID=UPI003AFA320B
MLRQAQQMEPTKSLNNGSESEGGVVLNSSHNADYLFSSDAAHCDTQKIYNSVEYIENKVTVFHASFLRTHSQMKTKTLMTLGHFILPPPSLHEEIRKAIGNFIWEQDDSSHSQQQSDEDDEPMNSENDQRPNIVTLPDVHPTRQDEDERTLSCRYTTDCNPEDIKLHTLHKYPENNMFSGYISIQQLKKFSGELNDFLPDASEYCVIYVHEECNNFQGLKTVHNKTHVN